MTKKRMLFIVLGLLLLINAGCSGSNESRNETKARAKTETASVKTAQGNDRLPNIRILATGGTIAGANQSKTSTTNYKAGAVGIDTLIEAVPEMKDIANISGEQVANIGSQNMTNKTLLKLSKRTAKLLASDDVDGIVVTHGTDTLEETAYFLNLVLKSDKPVVVVGSMRPSTAIGADGPANLYNAVKVAASKEAYGKGTMVVLNDRIAAARYVTKTHTTAPDTFKSEEMGYLAILPTASIFIMTSQKSIRKIPILIFPRSICFLKSTSYTGIKTTGAICLTLQSRRERKALSMREAETVQSLTRRKGQSQR